MADRIANVSEILLERLKALHQEFPEELPQEALAIDWLALFKDEYEQIASKTDSDQSLAESLLPFIAQWISCTPVIDKVTDPPVSDALKILFVGNSLTFENSLPLTVADLLDTAAEGKTKAKVWQVVNGGLTLENHWKYGVAIGVLNENGPWDYVVLQEQSVRAQEGSPKMVEYVQLFADEVRKTSAKLLLFSTWTNQSRWAKQSQTELDVRFTSLANLIGAQVVPAGSCWWRSNEKDPGIQLFKDDIHPSPTGTYLAACAFYCVLTGQSPEGLRTKGETSKVLTRQECLHLQMTAREVCQTLMPIAQQSNRL